jgi:hypothetical protein
MRRDPVTHGHLEDDQIVRLLDREASAREREVWEHHVAGCEPCRTEVETLRSQSAAITQWLARADFERSGHRPLPSARWGAPDQRPAGWRSALPARDAAAWLKAAAVVLLVAAPLVAIPGTREWIAERLAGDVGPAPSTLEVGDEWDGTATVVHFIPAPGTFTVAIAAGQEVGAITVGRSEPGQQAVLEVSDRSPEADPTRPETAVSAREVRIENDPSATASYTLLVPPEITAVIVVVGPRRTVVESHEIDGRAVVTLASRNR